MNDPVILKSIKLRWTLLASNSDFREWQWSLEQLLQTYNHV